MYFLAQNCIKDTNDKNKGEGKERLKYPGMSTSCTCVENFDRIEEIQGVGDGWHDPQTTFVHVHANVKASIFNGFNFQRDEIIKC